MSNCLFIVGSTMSMVILGGITQKGLRKWQLQNMRERNKLVRVHPGKELKKR